MATEIYYPGYDSWDKSIDIDTTLSDTLTLSANADTSSSVVKIIFETFGVDPDLLPPDSAFVRLYITSASVVDEGLCLTADYHHTRPITADDWTDAGTGDAIDVYPVSRLVSASGSSLDIPLTGLDGIRECPTGIRFMLLVEGALSGDNSVVIDGFSGNKAELHLTWTDDGGGGDGDNDGDGDRDADRDNDERDRDDRDGEDPIDRNRDDDDDDRPPRHDRPREVNEYAVYAAQLLAAKQRPTITYQGALRKGDGA